MCNPFESLLNITALLVRLVRTITKCLGIQKKVIWVSKKEFTVIHLHTLQYVVPLLLIAPIVGLLPIVD